MATKLEKNITRESTVTVDGREIMVTLTEDQEISFKLKGLRTGEVKISIREIYNQLAGIEDEGPKEKKALSISHNQPKTGTKNNPMISLYDLRSQSAISTLEYSDKAKFDGIIKKLIDSMGTKSKK